MDESLGLVGVFSILGQKGVKAATVSAVVDIRSVLTSEDEFLSLFMTVVETHDTEAHLLTGSMTSFVDTSASLFVLKISWFILCSKRFTIPGNWTRLDLWFPIEG